MRVDLLVCTYRLFNANSYSLITGMCSYTRRQGIDLYVPALHGSALVHRSRNAALNNIREDADYVLLCDDDMGPEKDSLLQLIERDVPVVSAYMVSREFPPKIAVQEYDGETDSVCQITNLKRDKLITASKEGKSLVVGTGFMLLKREIISQALEWHLAAMDWLADHRRMFDRLHVRSEQREREQERVERNRRAMYLNEKYHRLFHFCVMDNGIEAGEDFTFCRNLYRMGIPIAVDTGVMVSHIGDFPYSPLNLEDQCPEEVLV